MIMSEGKEKKSAPIPLGATFGGRNESANDTRV